MTLPIQAIIFDSDGTLLDSETLGMDLLWELARDAGLPLTRDEAHRRFRGVGIAEVGGWVMAELGSNDPDRVSAFVDRYHRGILRRFHEALAPMPGAVDLLAALRLPVAVATNGPREKVSLGLALTGLDRFFGDRVFSAPELGHFKPAPELFLIAARALNTPPERCAVVEDSLPGLVAGIAAGMRVYSLHPREGLPDDLADELIFIDSLSEFGRKIGLEASLSRPPHAIP